MRRTSRSSRRGCCHRRTTSRRSRCSTRRTRPHLPEQDPIELAARSLTRADRTRHELEQRLERAGIGDADRAEALETLERIGYVDDARVAVSRAETLAARGHGDEAIRFDLEGRGLEAEHVDAALAALAPERERARELAERLGRTPRTAARLQRTGFGADALEDAFGDGIAATDPARVE
jgi:SOS response regulatory protein OraA/RecX